MGVRRERLLTDIRQVDRLLERGAENIALQKRIISDLTDRGHASMAIEARKLLAHFQALQKQHMEHRGKLLHELDTLQNAGVLLAAE